MQQQNRARTTIRKTKATLAMQLKIMIDDGESLLLSLVGGVGIGVGG